MLKSGTITEQQRLGTTMRISAQPILTFRGERESRSQWELQGGKSESMTPKRM